MLPTYKYFERSHLMNLPPRVTGFYSSITDKPHEIFSILNVFFRNLSIKCFYMNYDKTNDLFQKIVYKCML